MDDNNGNLNKSRTKKKETINLSCIILICYLISFISNISFFFIFILSEYIYKWVGFLFIIVEVVLLQMSIRNIKNLKEDNFAFFRKISTILMLTILFNCLFFLVVAIYIIAKKKIAYDIIILFICCCFLWCAFHILFISILRYYVLNIKFVKKKPLYNI